MEKIRFQDSEAPGWPLTCGYLELRSVLKEGDRWVHRTNWEEWCSTLSTASDEDVAIAAGYVKSGNPNTYLVFVADSEAYYNLPVATERIKHSL